MRKEIAAEILGSHVAQHCNCNTCFFAQWIVLHSFFWLKNKCKWHKQLSFVLILNHDLQSVWCQQLIQHHLVLTMQKMKIVTQLAKWALCNQCTLLTQWKLVFCKKSHSESTSHDSSCSPEQYDLFPWNQPMLLFLQSKLRGCKFPSCCFELFDHFNVSVFGAWQKTFHPLVSATVLTHDLVCAVLADQLCSPPSWRSKTTAPFCFMLHDKVHQDMINNVLAKNFTRSHS